LPIALQGIKLNQLIKLTKTPTLNATGEVSGVANMTLDLRSSGTNAWAVADADLSSSKMGTIQYLKNENTLPSDKTTYLQEILSEFQFQHLAGQLTHNEDGDLQLLTRIVGSNESFKQGKKVDFNLTLNVVVN
jgi:hypothetical protein